MADVVQPKQPLPAWSLLPLLLRPQPLAVTPLVRSIKLHDICSASCLNK